MKKWISAALAAVLVLSMFGGCANSNTEMDSTNISSDNASISQSTAETTETDSVQAGSDMFTERDYRTEYDESGSVQIQLNGDSYSYYNYRRGYLHYFRHIGRWDDYRKRARYG